MRSRGERFSSKEKKSRGERKKRGEAKLNTHRGERRKKIYMKSEIIIK